MKHNLCYVFFFFYFKVLFCIASFSSTNVQYNTTYCISPVILRMCGSMCKEVYFRLKYFLSIQHESLWNVLVSRVPTSGWHTLKFNFLKTNSEKATLLCVFYFYIQFKQSIMNSIVRYVQSFRAWMYQTIWNASDFILYRIDATAIHYGPVNEACLIQVYLHWMAVDHKSAPHPLKTLQSLS